MNLILQFRLEEEEQNNFPDSAFKYFHRGQHIILDFSEIVCPV